MAKVMAQDRACIVYGPLSVPHIALTWQPRVGGVQGGKGRHGEDLWRERGRRWVLPLRMRVLLLRVTEKFGVDKSTELHVCSQRRDRTNDDDPFSDSWL